MDLKRCPKKVRVRAMQQDRASSLLGAPPDLAIDGDSLTAVTKMGAYILFILLQNVTGNLSLAISTCTTSSEAYGQLKESFIRAKEVAMQKLEREFHQISIIDDPRITLSHLMTLQRTLSALG